MFPDFLELFGVDLFGLQFERGFWLVGLAFALWGLWGGIVQVKDGERDAGWLRVVISAAALLWVGYYAAMAWFAADSYQLLFTEELVIHTYAFCIVSGFLTGTWLTAREGIRVGLQASKILDIAFWCLISGLIGSRLVFMLVSAQDYVDACVDPGKVGLAEADCFKAFKFWEGGLVFFGAFLGAALTLAIYTKRHKIPFRKLADTAIPALALGQFFGRLGCLGAGCCWGEVCTSGWGVVFKTGEMPYKDALNRYFEHDPTVGNRLYELGQTLPLHPVQLYESMGELCIFVILILFRSHKRIHGGVFALWMVLYGFFRTVTEITRGDKIRGYLFELTIAPVNKLLRIPATHPTFFTTSQIVGLVVGFAGIGLFVWFRRQAGRELPLV